MLRNRRNQTRVSLQKGRPVARKPHRSGLHLGESADDVAVSAICGIAPENENTVAKAISPGPTTFLEFLWHANCFHVVHDNTGTFDQIVHHARVE
jgi:hypothetical protein